MKVVELKNQIDQLMQTKGDKLTVEVVYKDQKHFIQRVDNPDSTRHNH